MGLKQSTYKILEKGSHGKAANRVFDFIIMGFIILSVISIILESIDEVNNQIGSFLKIFNIITVIIFSVEYILRIYISDLTHPEKNKTISALKFIFSANGIIDLLAILPFYLPMVTRLDLRFLRMLRLTRFLRILKVNRYNNSLNLIWDVIKEKKPELAVTGFVTFTILVLSSFIMYYVEGEKQPESFPNILASFWWAVATLTTVGYGDVYPITALGKIISGLIAILGIGLIALPTGIIGSGFMSKIEEQKGNKITCPHCGKEINE